MIENKKELVKNIIIGTFTSIPLLSSLISTIHLIDLFNLGNPSWMSLTLAIAFELGSIASLLILVILDKINKGMVMTIFIILMIFQILGNVYFSFDYINKQLAMDPQWLGSFQELISYFVSGDIILMKVVVAFLVGVPIPLISLFFLKSVVDYLKFEENITINSDTEVQVLPVEIPVIEPTNEGEASVLPDVEITDIKETEEPQSEELYVVNSIDINNDIIIVNKYIPKIELSDVSIMTGDPIYIEQISPLNGTSPMD